MVRYASFIAWVGLAVLASAHVARAQEGPGNLRFSASTVKEAATLLDLSFTAEEVDSMVRGLATNVFAYRALHNLGLDNSVPPALVFNPHPRGFRVPTARGYLKLPPAEDWPFPTDSADLAFASIQQLGVWLRRGDITSVQLTQFFLNRLKTHDPTLHCVVTRTDSLALAEAQHADAELAKGLDYGPLHGIPYGIKDLFAVKGYRTTWGAGGFEAQQLDEDATVVKALRAAGAVLVAKLTLGELAMGDTWFGGKTLNPFNLAQGSSGSSAGSASAVAAGLVPFAIGTETLGSIVSPSTVCGTTGLRPTFGRIDRTGAMALSWSMDKIGPICRSALDCAIVFDALYRAEGDDPAHRYAPFQFEYDPAARYLRVGYLKTDFDADYPFHATDSTALAVFRGMGIQLVPLELPAEARTSLTFLLLVEAAAAFDELTRTGADDKLVQQGRNAWPNLFRVARFTPAVEYVQANRARTLLINAYHKLLDSTGVDVILAPSWQGQQLSVTNLTGHPCVVLPTGSSGQGAAYRNHSTCLLGRLYREEDILLLAHAYQQATQWHQRRPEGFSK